VTLVPGMIGYLALGSNLGERERYVLEAVRRLDAAGITVVTCSSLYETLPADGVVGRNFVNAVVEVRTLLCAEDLLKRLQAIEKSMGRIGGHNRSREIDIDILSLGDVVLKADNLTIPHPRFGERAFVLMPLGEIAPEFYCPLTRRSIMEMVGKLSDNLEIKRISDRRIIVVTSQ